MIVNVTVDYLDLLVAVVIATFAAAVAIFSFYETFVIDDFVLVPPHNRKASIIINIINDILDTSPEVHVLFSASEGANFHWRGEVLSQIEIWELNWTKILHDNFLCYQTLQQQSNAPWPSLNGSVSLSSTHYHDVQPNNPTFAYHKTVLNT